MKQFFIYQCIYMKLIKTFLLLILFFLPNVVSAQYYSGYVGDYITLPEPTLSGGYTIRASTFFSTSKHLDVATGTSRVKILSYFTGYEIVQCDYYSVRQYTVAGKVYDDYQSGTAYYFISCIGGGDEGGGNEGGGDEGGGNEGSDPDSDPTASDYFSCTYHNTRLGYKIISRSPRECAVHRVNDLFPVVDVPSIANGYTVTMIDEAAFKNCNRLWDVGLPNTIKEIGNEAFIGCSDLTDITIPSEVTSIGKNAFKNCSSLVKIISQSENPPSFIDDPDNSQHFYRNAVLYVPSESAKAKYSNMPYWNEFKEIKIIESTSGIKSVKDNDNNNNKSSRILDLGGRQMNKPRKGINIINGKKVLVK